MMCGNTWMKSSVPALAEQAFYGWTRTFHREQERLAHEDPPRRRDRTGWSAGPRAPAGIARGGAGGGAHATAAGAAASRARERSEEHTSELQSLMRLSYAV